MFLSVFDLDKTLLKKNSSVAFCKYLYKKKVISLAAVCSAIIYYVRHLYFGLPLESLHQKAFHRILSGLSLNFLQEQISCFLDEHLDGLLYAPAVESLRLAQKENHYTVILSSSPAFLVSPIARWFGVDESKASQYLIDKDGRLCQIAIILQGEEKACLVEAFRLQLEISKEAIIAYSDSYLDLPFLLSAGSKVVVNPDRRLKKLSKKWGWKQI